MKILIIILTVFCLACGNEQAARIVRAKNPGCDVLKVERIRSDRHKVTFQCGNTSPKTTIINKR